MHLYDSTYAKTAIVGAIALIMMLTWNDLIQTVIKTYFTPGGTIFAKLLYALTITAIGGIILTHLNRSS